MVYTIEYAASRKSNCKNHGGLIPKGELRLGKSTAKSTNKQWSCWGCVSGETLNEIKRLIESGSNPEGVNKISQSDQKRVYKAISTGTVAEEDVYVSPTEAPLADSEAGHSRKSTAKDDQLDGRKQDAKEKTRPTSKERKGREGSVQDAAHANTVDSETTLSSPFSQSQPRKRGEHLQESPSSDTRAAKKTRLQPEVVIPVYKCSGIRTLSRAKPVSTVGTTTQNNARSVSSSRMPRRSGSQPPSISRCSPTLAEIVSNKVDSLMTPHPSKLRSSGALRARSLKRATSESVKRPPMSSRSEIPPKLSLDDFCEQYQLSANLKEKLNGMRIPGPHVLRLIKQDTLESNLEIGEFAELRDAEERWREDVGH
ncbi:hypothetical protein PQX77_010144 [Marasmius sp. AFHP31]|nr:hypothetical protein PQX77_010144 [Marasmius sp. AFHP31]